MPLFSSSSRGHITKKYNYGTENNYLPSWQGRLW